MYEKRGIKCHLLKIQLPSGDILSGNVLFQPELSVLEECRNMFVAYGREVKALAHRWITY